MKCFYSLLVGLILCGAGFYAFNAFIYHEKQAPSPVAPEYTHTDTEFLIDGTPLRIGDTLQYFGNDFVYDLNNDGRDDVIFLVTHTPGGSGTFFYVVAAVQTDAGYRGSDGYLLGDRIAPQTIELSQMPRHRDVIVVNYADRRISDPMTAQPSVGMSAYLKLDTESLRWGVVEPDFEGESDPERMTLGMKSWEWQRALYNDGRELVPTRPNAFSLTFSDTNTFSATTDCNSAGGTYAATDTTLTFSDVFMTQMYCEGSQEQEFLTLLNHTRSYHFTSNGELVFDLMFDSGTVIFR